MTIEREITRRPPETVMRLSRLGCLHQCRLSFMRTLTRRMAGEEWAFSRPVFEISDSGVGHAVYTAQGPDREYSLVAFAHDLPDHLRSDRVIAEAWDATFVLFDGTPGPCDIRRLAENVPKQEAGRLSEKELTLSRANRSARLWDYVVDSLAAGHQPDAGRLEAVGYLMRTTAVYGSGKFGAADRSMIEDRPEMRAPFQAEMLTVYLIRAFVRDLVDHLAQIKGGGRAARIDASLAQSLGIGNSTGLGMAPFLINHPILINNWIMAREEAIARVRNVQNAAPEDQALFLRLVRQTVILVNRWTSAHPLQVAKISELKRDVSSIEENLSTFEFSGLRPWDRLFLWAARSLSTEGQELLNSLMLEPYGALVDDLIHCMADDRESDFRIDGSTSLHTLIQMLLNDYDWALAIDWDQPDSQDRAWYVSEEKLEPRLGQRYAEPIADYEQPLAPGRDMAGLYTTLQEWPETSTVADFLTRHPEHRLSVRRLQIMATAPYGEIRDNTIASDLLPIDMLRAKLSFFGATYFDPRSDRWLRISMYAGAPYPKDLSVENGDRWVYPQ